MARTIIRWGGGVKCEKVEIEILRGGKCFQNFRRWINSPENNYMSGDLWA